MTSPTAPGTLLGEDDILVLLRELIADHVDLGGRPVEMSTALAEIGVDSLAAAEILFALEDRLCVPLGEPTEPPATVRGVVDYALDALRRPRQGGLH